MSGSKNRVRTAQRRQAQTRERMQSRGSTRGSPLGTGLRESGYASGRAEGRISHPGQGAYPAIRPTRPRSTTPQRPVRGAAYRSNRKTRQDR